MEPYVKVSNKEYKEYKKVVKQDAKIKAKEDIANAKAQANFELKQAEEQANLIIAQAKAKGQTDIQKAKDKAAKDVRTKNANAAKKINAFKKEEKKYMKALKKGENMEMPIFDNSIPEEPVEEKVAPAPAVIEEPKTAPTLTPAPAKEEAKVEEKAVAPVKEEPKAEVKPIVIPKEEPKVEIKEEVKEEVKEEIKEEPKAEVEEKAEETAVAEEVEEKEDLLEKPRTPFFVVPEKSAELKKIEDDLKNVESTIDKIEEENEDETFIGSTLSLEELQAGAKWKIECVLDKTGKYVVKKYYYMLNYFDGTILKSYASYKDNAGAKRAINTAKKAIDDGLGSIEGSGRSYKFLYKTDSNRIMFKGKLRFGTEEGCQEVVDLLPIVSKKAPIIEA